MKGNIDRVKELENVLLTYEKPSVYFKELRENKNLELDFPEIYDLIGVIQSPIMRNVKRSDLEVTNLYGVISR